MSAAPSVIPLRFQRAELEAKADLTEAGRRQLARLAHPERLIEALVADDNRRDAIHALTLMLPHRQAVWWACLAVRLMPDLDRRPVDLAAVGGAERWVQGGIPADAQAAGELADACDPDFAPAWAATAAFWAGPSLAPRGQQAVPPAPHLTGMAVRGTLRLLTWEPTFIGKVGFDDWLDIGLALMRGQSGVQAQAGLKTRLSGA